MSDSAFGRNVPIQMTGIVPLTQSGHIGRNYISHKKIEELAIKKYKSSGYGITFQDVMEIFSIKKAQAQRKLKYFHARGILFTGEELSKQGIEFIQRTNPQMYFPICIKADIIEGLKKRKNEPVEATGVNLPKGTLNQLEGQKAQTFLDVLLYIPFVPLYMHKLQLMTCIDKEYYNHLPQKEVPINRAKCHEENIGRRHVKYTLSPNGTVEIAVKSSDTPFRIETDDDELILFSFLGQVKDRFLYLVRDPKELYVPSVMQWVLKQCDLNKDVEINDKAQVTLPDIQLKTAARVFRLYIKSLEDKAVCRAEESVKLDLLLPEALDNIRHPYKSIDSRLLDIAQQIKDVPAEINKKMDNSLNNSSVQSTASNSQVGGHD